MEYVLVPAEVLGELVYEDEGAGDFVERTMFTPDPIGPHYFEPYHKDTYFESPRMICGYRGCGASRRNAIHI